MMVTAIGTYLVKILVLIFFLGTFQRSMAFNGKLFGLTAIVCVLVWTVAQMVRRCG